MRTIHIVERATGKVLATATYTPGDAAAQIDTEHERLRADMLRARTLTAGRIGPEGGDAYMDALMRTFAGGYVHAEEVRG